MRTHCPLPFIPHPFPTEMIFQGGEAPSAMQGRQGHPVGWQSKTHQLLEASILCGAVTLDRPRTVRSVDSTPHSRAERSNLPSCSSHCHSVTFLQLNQHPNEHKDQVKTSLPSNGGRGQSAGAKVPERPRGHWNCGLRLSWRDLLPSSSGEC